MHRASRIGCAMQRLPALPCWLQAAACWGRGQGGGTCGCCQARCGERLAAQRLLQAGAAARGGAGGPHAEHAALQERHIVAARLHTHRASAWLA